MQKVEKHIVRVLNAFQIYRRGKDQLPKMKHAKIDLDFLLLNSKIILSPSIFTTMK